MLIKYIHISEPEKEKIHDTTLVLKNNPFITKSQKELDDFTLQRLTEDKEKGIIISYEVIKEEKGDELNV